MLKRISHLIAAASAAIIIAAPGAQAGDRNGWGHHDRDGGRQVTRDRHYRAPQARVGRHYYSNRYYNNRYRHFRYAPPRIVWVPRYRHHNYRGWHRDRYYNLAILFAALETVRTGFTHYWHDPDMRISGEVTPTRTYQLASGQYCREYQQQIVVDNRPVEGYGRACRQPDGSWQTVD